MHWFVFQQWTTETSLPFFFCPSPLLWGDPQTLYWWALEKVKRGPLSVLQPSFIATTAPEEKQTLKSQQWSEDELTGSSAERQTVIEPWTHPPPHNAASTVFTCSHSDTYAKQPNSLASAHGSSQKAQAAKELLLFLSCPDIAKEGE